MADSGNTYRTQNNTHALESRAMTIVAHKTSVVQRRLHFLEKFKKEIGEKNIKSIYVSENGGFYIMVKGHNYYEDELNCAKIMADHGMIIRMLPEGTKFGTLRAENGKYREGKIYNNLYEQSSPTVFTERAMPDKIEHAQRKRAHTAVIYDTLGKFLNDNFERARARFKGAHKGRKIYVKRLIIVTKEGQMKTYKI